MSGDEYTRSVDAVKGMETWPGEQVTLRHYLLTRACLSGADIWTAMEAVSSTAIEHPEWDMDERRIFDEWEATR